MNHHDRHRQKRARRFQARERPNDSLGPQGLKVVACGKLCYPSKSRAGAAVKSSVCRNIPGKELIGAYYCEKCSAWHIGHDNRPEVVR